MCICTYQCKAPLPHIQAEVGEGGDSHSNKIQIPTMKRLHFVKNDRRDCILVSCNMYNNKAPLPGGRLMVDSPTIPHLPPPSAHICGSGALH